VRENTVELICFQILHFVIVPQFKLSTIDVLHLIVSGVLVLDLVI